MLVEQALGIAVPTREEMAEIEASSRLYQEGGAHYHDGHRPAPAGHRPPSRRSRRRSPSFSPAHRLVTVRYAEPRAFPIFLGRAQKKDAACMTGTAVLVGLLEAIIDREADRVERIQGEVDKLSQTHLRRQGRRAHARAPLRRQHPRPSAARAS